jgi:hypothetical protein
VFGEGAEQFADSGADGFHGSGGSFAQEVLELCEDLLDRIEVGRVFRQNELLPVSRTPS